MSLMIKIRLAVVAMLILALVIPISGCGSNESSNESGKDVMARMMKMIPASAEDFSFYNFKAYREDNRLMNLLSESNHEDSGPTLYYYIKTNNDYMGFNDDIYLWIYEGDVKLHTDPGTDPSYKYDSYEYKGVIITVEGDYDEAHAVVANTFISGYVDHVKECIDVIVGDAPSFYDHSGYKEILNHLHDGLNMEIWDASGYSEDIIAEGSSTIFVGNGFQTIYVTITKDGNFLESTEFQPE